MKYFYNFTFATYQISTFKDIKFKIIIKNFKLAISLFEYYIYKINPNKMLRLSKSMGFLEKFNVLREIGIGNKCEYSSGLIKQKGINIFEIGRQTNYEKMT